MTKVVIKILQGSAVTENQFGGLIVHHLVANLLQYMSAKSYENRLTWVKVTNEEKGAITV